MPPHDIDAPNNVERTLEGMKAFLDRNSVGGVLQFPADDRNFNRAPIPARFLKPPGPDVIVRFESIEQFKHVHKSASEFEDALETKEVDEFNNDGISFKAWPLVTMPHDDDVEMWVILVESKPIIETRIPGIGETCQLRLVDSTTGKGRSAWWPAKRTYNNFASAGESKKNWSKLIAFNVTLVRSEDDTNSVIHALIPNDGNQKESLASLVLDVHNAVDVGLFFTKSDATFDAEMRSLSKLVRAARVPPPKPHVTMAEAMDKTTFVQKWLDLPQKPLLEPEPAKKPVNSNAVQPKQVAAFKYLLNFGEPQFVVNMFQLYPHMRQPNQPGSGIPPAIMKKFARMDDHQRKAYAGLLANMPCGLGLLPGGPGSGKTDWVMTVIGLMQSKTKAKVLYLLDINGPLDDATAKYIKLMQNADLAKRAIRMKNFGTELKKSIRIGSVQEHARNGNGKSRGTIGVDNENEPDVDFSKNFLSLYTQHTAGMAAEPTKARHQHIIPTLDEAAWDHYEKYKDEFHELAQLLETCNGSALENRALRFQIFYLYQAVLQLADFIATTPCVAASAFNRMFAPDLIVFDEAAHARELSTLIAIANFCPKAGWILIGDHRQTQPTVKSNNTNPHGRQLATSAMERAHLAGVLDYQLLINHRAFGRLERLPSKLIYEGKMISGIAFRKRIPRWMASVRQYLQGFASYRCSVPRLIVHLHGVGRPVRAGKSWYHPQHMRWTMERVLELAKNKKFRSAESQANQGTILLLAPYKAAVMRYQEAIEELARSHPSLRILQRVEARTWDSAQGHEADVVGIDYVRDHPTDFMDGMYRFNVGLTRARQGEWHLMHPDMPRAQSFHETNYLRKLYNACENGLDGLGEGAVAHLVWGAETPAVPKPEPSALFDAPLCINTATEMKDFAGDATILPTPSTLYTSSSSAASRVSLAEKAEADREMSPITTNSTCESVHGCDDNN